MDDKRKIKIEGKDEEGRSGGGRQEVSQGEEI